MYHFHLYRHQTVVIAVELCPHVGGEQQFAVQIECPAVIGADQLRALAFGGGADAGAAVAAGVVEGADSAAVVAHDNDRIVANLQGDVFAGVADLETVARKDPGSMPDLLQILLVDVRVVVQLVAQGVARLALPDQFQCFCFV